jgi:excisionase family DNA binding protein
MDFANDQEFLSYLKSFDLITYKYDFMPTKTVGWNRSERTSELKLHSVEFNMRNFELLISNDLITNDVDQHRLLNINQVCGILNVTRPTVYKIFEEGDLKFYQIGDQRKVRFLDLMSYIEAQKPTIEKEGN